MQGTYHILSSVTTFEYLPCPTQRFTNLTPWIDSITHFLKNIIFDKFQHWIQFQKKHHFIDKNFKWGALVQPQAGPINYHDI